jgi:hypothetical protein
MMIIIIIIIIMIITIYWFPCRTQQPGANYRVRTNKKNNTNKQTQKKQVNQLMLCKFKHKLLTIIVKIKNPLIFRVTANIYNNIIITIIINKGWRNLHSDEHHSVCKTTGLLYMKLQINFLYFLNILQNAFTYDKI